VVEIVNVLREQVPALRFIGRRYTHADRDATGGFTARWQEWFAADRFSVLEAIGPAPEHGDARFGLMRFTTAGEFEYWIGMFFPAGTPVPGGFEFVDVPACTFGTCWLYGQPDTGELYGETAHRLCLEQLQRQGWRIAEAPWFMERYNHPRFTTPDAHGKVVLDYCVQLAD